MFIILSKDPCFESHYWREMKQFALNKLNYHYIIFLNRVDQCESRLVNPQIVYGKI
jgi:hypothetical protein